MKRYSGSRHFPVQNRRMKELDLLKQELDSQIPAHLPEPIRTELIRVASQSDYFARYLALLLERDDVFDKEMNQLASSYTGREIFDAISKIRPKDSIVKFAGDDPGEKFSSVDLDNGLRRVRQQEMARIIFRDFSRRADLLETTRDLSDLADACIQFALDFHYEQNVARYGTPRSNSGEQQHMCVLALGKLGAHELNVSSDIDLIFFYGESGEVDGESELSNQEFFIRLSRQIIKSLDTNLATGFVFRVDMRLRPYGESGALILTQASMEKYFVEQGRDWERYAFIKARAAAGNLELGTNFLKWISPFVYRRHLDYGAIEALREMKGLINKEVEQRELTDDVKLGPGGIREVEFIVQAHQLIWGGNKPELRQNQLMKVLPLLETGGFIPVVEARSLYDAYVFLRNTEHAIQAEKDRQTQKLPDEDLARARLAEVMGYSFYAEFLTALDAHRTSVSACFGRLMSQNNAEQEVMVEGNLFWLSIWRDLSSSSSVGLMEQNGYSTTSLAALENFQLSLKDIQPIGLDRVDRLMPVMIRACSNESSPDDTLLRLIPIVSSVIRRSTYLVFLLENKDALIRLVHLCAMSPWVAERVASYPILMYELTDKSTEEVDLDPESLALILKLQLDQFDKTDLEGRMDCLRQFKNASVLKVAVLELLNLIPLKQASGALTIIAELILDAATDLAFDYLITKHGMPCDTAGVEQGRCFAVIAYGKLGGLELAYGSDLDVVFLHDADIRGETNGTKPVANTVFFSRLGQRIVHILSSFTRFGVLYEVDLRLRPDGNKGPLVGTFNAFERYLQQDAWTWEHQALVRARYVAGDISYELRFQAIRSRMLASRRDIQKLRQDVIAMREKMRNHLDSSKLAEAEDVLVSGFDLKQGSGAIVDIEFLVQYLVLAHCGEHPALSQWTDKTRLMDMLVEKKLLTEDEAILLQGAYVAYRSAVHYTWLGGQMSSYSELNKYREKVIEIWQKYLEYELL